MPLTLRLTLGLVVIATAAGCIRQPRVVDPTGYLQQLQSPDNQVRRRAAEALASLRDPTAVPTLIAAVQQEGYLPALRAELRALGMSGSPEAYPVIVSHTRHGNPKVARAAADAYRLWLRHRLPAAGTPALAPEAPPAAAPAPPPSPPLQDHEE